MFVVAAGSVEVGQGAGVGGTDPTPPLGVAVEAPVVTLVGRRRQLGAGYGAHQALAVEALVPAVGVGVVAGVKPPAPADGRHLWCIGPQPSRQLG